MANYSMIHETKAYTVYVYNFVYIRKEALSNFLVCFTGNTNIYTLAELKQRYSKLTVKQQRIIDIVCRKYSL